MSVCNCIELNYFLLGGYMRAFSTLIFCLLYFCLTVFGAVGRRKQLKEPWWPDFTEQADRQVEI